MILQAIERAYRVMQERNWDTIYWAVDLHGVCLKSNYENGGYSFINETAKKGLQAISARKENVIILWSSCHDHEKQAIIDFFNSNGILVDYFNENPDEANTKTGCFDQKFYFSVLLDDKAGFDPDEHWFDIIEFYEDMDAEELPPAMQAKSELSMIATTFAGGTALGLLSSVLFPTHSILAAVSFLVGAFITQYWYQREEQKSA